MTNSNQAAKSGMQITSIAAFNAAILSGAVLKQTWEFVARDKNGKVKWTERMENLITNVGLNFWLDALTTNLSAQNYYVGLTDGTPTTAAGDTMSSHAGWVEVTAYDEAARQTLTLAAASSQARAGTPVVFTISTNGTTIGGGFITTVSTKGGTTGTLLAVGAFTAGDKSLDDNDTLTVTPTLSLASA
jgi:hypothetical protein